MARITFSIPDDLAKIAEQRATDDRRSLSAHISILVENDARASGLIKDTGAHAEIIAYANTLGATRALSALKRAARATKQTA